MHCYVERVQSFYVQYLTQANIGGWRGCNTAEGTAKERGQGAVCSLRGEQCANSATMLLRPLSSALSFSSFFHP